MNTIILEGPDGSGKSTLAEAFKTLNYKVEHFGVPPYEVQRDEQKIFDFFYEPLNEAIYLQDDQDEPRPCIFDRLHLSDRIYGPLMRKGSAMTLRAELMIERLVEAVDGQIVICLPPYRVALANWLNRNKNGKEYVDDIKVYAKVYKAYVDLLFNHKRNRNFLWYDYTRHRARPFANGVSEFKGNPLPAGCYGSQNPRFFIWLPGVSMTNINGPYGTATKKLFSAGYQEHEIQFCNWKELPDRTPARTVIEMLQPKSITELASIRRNSP